MYSSRKHSWCSPSPLSIEGAENFRGLGVLVAKKFKGKYEAMFGIVIELEGSPFAICKWGEGVKDIGEVQRSLNILFPPPFSPNVQTFPGCSCLCAFSFAKHLYAMICIFFSLSHTPLIINFVLGYRQALSTIKWKVLLVLVPVFMPQVWTRFEPFLNLN